MALTAAQTQIVYEAVGLRASGNTYRLVRFNHYSVNSYSQSEITTDYASAKTKIDANLALLSDDENTRLGTIITKYECTDLSSLRLTGDVLIDDSKEHEMARQKIIDIVGIQIQPVDSYEEAKKAFGREDVEDNPRQGRVTR